MIFFFFEFLFWHFEIYISFAINEFLLNFSLSHSIINNFYLQIIYSQSNCSIEQSGISVPKRYIKHKRNHLKTDSPVQNQDFVKILTHILTHI